MSGVLFLLLKDLQRHLVKVKLPGYEEVRELGLIEVSALTNMLEDFHQSYPSISGVEAMLAEKHFGHEERWSTYGVFIDPQTLQYVHAFNRAFASYSAEQQEVVFTPLLDLVAQWIDEAPAPPTPPPAPVTRVIHETRVVCTGAQSVVFRYAILGGRDSATQNSGG